MQIVVNMWPMLASIDRGLVVSVSSLLIMLVFQPMVKDAIVMIRGIRRSVSHALVSLLAHDGYCGVMADAVARPPRRYCERCADRRGGEDGAAAPLSRHDVAAVIESLGLVVGEEDEEACGVCEAVATVEELTEGKVAGEGELREAFCVFDRDDDGYVTVAELGSTLRRLGMEEGARHDDCVRMIAAYDGDGDGRISFREFRSMMENAV